MLLHILNVFYAKIIALVLKGTPLVASNALSLMELKNALKIKFGYTMVTGDPV